MTVAVRVIPCLDVDGGRVVKGVNFRELRDAGDPVELAAFYDAEGADELTFLDITASSGGRDTMYDVVRRTAEQVFIPLTVGGGVRSAADVDRLLRAGADKVSLNTAAVARPELLAETAGRFGSQCMVLSVDARRADGPPSGFEVTTHGGRAGTGIDAVDWARQATELGAGEILLNSMDADGTGTCSGPSGPAAGAGPSGPSEPSGFRCSGLAALAPPPDSASTRPTTSPMATTTAVPPASHSRRLRRASSARICAIRSRARCCLARLLFDTSGGTYRTNCRFRLRRTYPARNRRRWPSRRRRCRRR